jgi:hypothetical protein
MKRRFVSFGAGVLILGVIFSLVAFVSNDARLSYVLGAILIFGGALYIGAKTKGDWSSAVLLCAPLVAAFAFSALRELPFLWPSLVLWVLSAVIGVRLMVPPTKITVKENREHFLHAMRSSASFNGREIYLHRASHRYWLVGFAPEMRSIWISSIHFSLPS